MPVTPRTYGCLGGLPTRAHIARVGQVPRSCARVEHASRNSATSAQRRGLAIQQLRIFTTKVSAKRHCDIVWSTCWSRAERQQAGGGPAASALAVGPDW